MRRCVFHLQNRRPMSQTLAASRDVRVSDVVRLEDMLTRMNGYTAAPWVGPVLRDEISPQSACVPDVGA